jgi:hypothetical protein
MKRTVILYLIGLVILAVAAGVIWLAFRLFQQQQVCGTILLVVAMIGVAWVGGKGWDTTNPFIQRYKMAFVFIVAWIPILDLIVPYWVGRGFARLTGLDDMIGAMVFDAKFKSGPKGTKLNSSGSLLETFLASMVTSTSEALEARDYQKAIDTATGDIRLCEQMARESPDLSDAYDSCLMALYALRAEARYGQSEQTESAEQLELARQDARKAQSLIAGLSGKVSESRLRELENRIQRILPDPGI